MHSPPFDGGALFITHAYNNEMSRESPAQTLTVFLKRSLKRFLWFDGDAKPVRSTGFASPSNGNDVPQAR
jgi:hypothetical protein